LKICNPLVKKMVSQTGSRLAGSNFCKRLNQTWKTAK